MFDEDISITEVRSQNEANFNYEKKTELVLRPDFSYQAMRPGLCQSACR